MRTRQVKLNIKSASVSGSIILASAFVMMILNVIFDTAFFGLSLNGKHNIYNNALFKSSCLSAFVYFLGLIVILALEYLYMKLVYVKSSNITLSDNKGE